MTIRDMLDAGIGIEGKVEVRAYTDEENYKSYMKYPCINLFSSIDDDKILDSEIMYMFSENDVQNENKLVIEVSTEEYLRNFMKLSLYI